MYSQKSTDDLTPKFKIHVPNKELEFSVSSAEMYNYCTVHIRNCRDLGFGIPL
jgi:hypothetical protein